MVSIVAFQESTPVPGYHALLPVLGTVALLAAGPEPTAVGRLLSLRPLTRLGDLSYSVYLWHWPVLVLWAARTGEERGALETASLLGVVLVLSLASFHLVENPVRRGRWWRRSPARGLVLWPVALAVVALAVVGGRDLAGDRLQQRIEQSREYASLRTAHLTVRQELSESLRRADAGGPIAFPLRDLSEVDELSKDLWNYEYECWVGHDRSRARLCPVGDTGAERTMVVLGDSHAGQWLPALDAIGLERGYRVVPLIKYGCVPYDVPQLTDDLTRPYTGVRQLPRLGPGGAATPAARRRGHRFPEHAAQHAGAAGAAARGLAPGRPAGSSTPCGRRRPTCGSSVTRARWTSIPSTASPTVAPPCPPAPAR